VERLIGAAMVSYRLGVDVGGTNTDLVLYNEASGEQLVEKLPSTPSNPAIAILKGVDQLIARGVSPHEIAFFAHGTTVTTNALLELKGARIGLFITDGYTGVIDVQTQTRGGNMFDYTFQRPTSLVSPDLIREIRGRVDLRGREITPLDTEAVRAGVQELAVAGIRSFAICYIFSFMNPAHERSTAEIIRSVVPDATISLSSSVMPRIREWPRFSTTLLNAYLEPILIRYIDELSTGLDKLGVQQPQRFLMQSNGGVMPFTAGHGNAVHTLLSGPAAGVQGSCHLIARDKFANLVSMDIGGTSCDIAFIEGATPHEITEWTIAGRQVDVPCLDIVTIAAGGGTIARVDRGGFLVVGPESAGALPGPACFGRGGTQPTVTDAYIVCGFLNEGGFLGGAQKVDAAAAHRAIETYLAKPLELTVVQAATGIFRIINARIADEIRFQAAKKGIDLATFTLVAFGGAGPLHAAAVAEELGIQKYLVPFSPGAFSAVGLLCSDIIHDFLRSDLADVSLLTPEAIERHFAALRDEAAAALRGEKLNLEDCIFLRELDMRYAGQGYELRVGIDHLTRGGSLDLAALREAFHALHYQQHGHSARDAAVEIVSYCLRAKVKTNKISMQANAQTPVASSFEGVEPGRDVRFGSDDAIRTPVIPRSELVRTGACTGPAIVVQFDTTTVIPRGWTARADATGNMIVERNGRD
jgi:N-methylhydantoinase A